MTTKLVSILAILLWVSCAEAGSLVQQKSENHSSATVNCNFTSNVTPGNLAVLNVSIQAATGGALSAVTGLNATWTKALAETNGTSSDVEIWATIAGSSPGTTVTMTVPGTAPSTYCYLTEWSGYTSVQDSGSPVGSASSIAPGSITTTNANDLLIAGAISTSAGTTTPTSPWVTLTQVNNFNVAYYQLVSSTGTYTPVPTTGTGSTASVFAAYKAVASTPHQGGVIIPLL